MLTDERKRYLLDILGKDGRIVGKDESVRLAVSEDTIRRDLRELAAEGKLKRVHGGALPASPAMAGYEARLPLAAGHKVRIGRRAASFITDGQVVFLDGGTTAAQVARHISHDVTATILTHSPTIVMELLEHERLTVELIGGRIFRHSVVTVGAEALQQLNRYLPDLCFIGATGAHAEFGITTGDAEEAQMKRCIMERSGEVNLLLSPEKIGAVSPFLIAQWPSIDRVFGEDLPEEFCAALKLHNCQTVDCR